MYSYSVVFLQDDLSHNGAKEKGAMDSSARACQDQRYGISGMHEMKSGFYKL